MMMAAVATLREIPTNGLSLAIGFFTRTIRFGFAFATLLRAERFFVVGDFVSVSGAIKIFERINI